MTERKKMDLKISCPNSAPDSTVFSIPFDLDEKGKKRGGIFTCDREKIRIYADENAAEPLKTLNIKDYKEYRVTVNAGCSMFTALTEESGGQSVFICNFSQKHFTRFAEMSRILDYYVKTGEFIDHSDALESSCPKCGAKLRGSSECPFCCGKAHYFKQLMQRVKPYLGLVLITFLLMIIAYATQIISPRLQGTIIDDFVSAEEPDMTMFWILGAVMIALPIIRIIIWTIVDLCDVKLGAHFIRDLRRDMFAKVEQLSMHSISVRTPGEIIRRVNDDTSTISNFISGELKNMLMHTVALIAIAVIMFISNWRLALLVVIPFPFVFWFTGKTHKILGKRSERWWRKNANSSRYLHDVLSGIRVVKSYGSERFESERYNKISKEVSSSQRNLDCVCYLLFPIADYVMAIGEFLMLYFGASMVLGLFGAELQITLGEMVEFTNYVYMLYGPIDWLTRLPRQLSQANVAMSKTFELINETVEIKDKPNAVSPEIKGEITFDKVTFGYTDYDPVLRDISCSIKQGEMIGVVGHSGVGKSTMINLIMRLYDPNSGSIKIDGTDLRDISGESLHGQMGVVLQETFLFNGTVLENIAYAKPDASFEEIIKAAKTANCHDFITQLPDGYNTYVGEKGYNLSGGERQRIAIARAILRDPKILILDEATASLDTATERQIQEALGRLIKGRTTIAIAHRLSTLSNADRLIVLDKGKLAEMGTHKELMRKHGVYYGLVMAQRSTSAIKPVNA